MKYQNFIGFIIVLSLFSSCSAISDFFDKSKKVTETSKTVIDQVDKVLLESKTIYDDLNNLDPISRTGIIDNIKSSGYSVENYYNYFYLDSIQSELATNGSVKIEPYEGFIVDHLNKTNKNDTIYLANLYLTTLNWGNVMSIEYEVAKNDIIFYEFENVKSSKINEIEMVDGSEIRFKHLNLKRNDKQV